MMGADNLHSQIVTGAKIILPLCALALLSTLFLFARSTGTPPAVTLAEVEAIAREQRVSAPEFSGLTDDGAVVVIAARSARADPLSADRVSLEGLQMRMDNPDGTGLRVAATEGEVDGRARLARFFGLARLDSSAGYQMETNGLLVSLDTGEIASDGLLEVRAPFGDLTAGKVEFTWQGDGIGQQILFTGGVRLLYTPQGAQTDSPARE